MPTLSRNQGVNFDVNNKICALSDFTAEEGTIPDGENASRVTRGWIVGKMIEPFRCEFCNVRIVNRFPLGFLDANDGAV
jgi:hypothetical protein